MRRTILHNIALGLGVCSLLSLAACHSELGITPSGTEEATLYLNIAPLGQTRASTADLLDNEKMKSLRVVVLHADGTVEHNNHYSVSSAEQETKYIILKVTPSETKKIFLFANEESVTAVGEETSGESLSAFFNRYPKEASGFADAVNGLYFAPDYTGGKAIPMSSVYEVTTPEKGLVQKTFYVVRVATKFTVNFENRRDEAVTLNKFTIANYADKNYLMAHVGDTERNRSLFAGYASWIEWLKAVSDASSESDSYATTEAAGWLKDYDLPTQANTQTYTHEEPLTVDAMTAGGTSATPIPGIAKTVFYLPESKNLKADADGEQEYAMVINIAGKEEPFSFTLPNLKALFRNTHVVIKITLYNKELRFKLTVEPWVEGGRTEIDVIEEETEEIEVTDN